MDFRNPLQNIRTSLGSKSQKRILLYKVWVYQKREKGKMTSNVKMPTDGIKMNEDLKDFLKDLNSGKWKQCRGKLGTKDDQYCFFGAMYEYFMEKNPGVVKKSFDKIGCAHYTIDSDSRYGFPHTQLLDFFGITKEWGRAISLLNDREKFSFKQIVKEIKKNVS